MLICSVWTYIFQTTAVEVTCSGMGKRRVAPTDDFSVHVGTAGSFGQRLQTASGEATGRDGMLGFGWDNASLTKAKALTTHSLTRLP